MRYTLRLTADPRACNARSRRSIGHRTMLELLDLKLRDEAQRATRRAAPPRFVPPHPGPLVRFHGDKGVRTTPRRVLGISAFYHDAAAALVVDGAVVAAAQEERFSRHKHDARFPDGA